MENSGENVINKPRGRPRLPERQGLENLTPVEYRRIYQKQYYTLHPRQPREHKPSPPKPKEPPKDGKRRGRPSHNLSDEEKKVRIREYRQNYSNRHREHVLDHVKKYQERKREETVSKIKHLENLISLYNVANAIRGNQQDMPREGADKV